MLMRLPFLCVILFLVNTCENSKSIRPVELNQEFLLKFQESAIIKSEKLAIRFMALVQESRCPKEVQCITAGKAEIALQLRKRNEKMEQIQLSTEPANDETRYAEYKIKLLDVLPYPITPEQNDPSRYSVRLIISQRP